MNLEELKKELEMTKEQAYADEDEAMLIDMEILELEKEGASEEDISYLEDEMYEYQNRASYGWDCFADLQNQIKELEDGVQ